MANPFGSNGEVLRVNTRHPLAHKLHAALIPRNAGKGVEVVRQIECISGQTVGVYDAEGFFGTAGDSGAGMGVIIPGITADEPFTLIVLGKNGYGNTGGASYPSAGIQNSSYGYMRAMAEPDSYTDRLAMYFNDNASHSCAIGNFDMVSVPYFAAIIRTNGITDHRVSYTSSTNDALTGAITLKTQNTTDNMDMSGYTLDKIGITGGGNWRFRAVLVFKADLSDAEVRSVLSEPSALIEKVVRRSRFLPYEEPCITQPTERVNIIQKYRPFTLGAWIAGVGNLYWMHDAVNPVGGWVGLPQGTAYNRTANDQYIIAMAQRGPVPAITIVSTFVANSPGNSWARFLCGTNSDGPPEIRYGINGWENFGFRIYADQYQQGTDVFLANDADRVFDRIVTVVCTWHKDKNSGYGRMWIDGRELARTGGSPQTVDSAMQMSYALMAPIDDGSTIKVMSGVVLGTDMHPTDAFRISKNGWGIFAKPRRTIFTGAPVITHKQRRVL